MHLDRTNLVSSRPELYEEVDNLGTASSRLRLCFASPSHEQIRDGVAVLAEVCRKEFGAPERIANVEKHAELRLVRRNADEFDVDQRGLARRRHALTLP
jgi:hypothetical protein